MMMVMMMMAHDTARIVFVAVRACQGKRKRKQERGVGLVSSISRLVIKFKF